MGILVPLYIFEADCQKIITMVVILFFSTLMKDGFLLADSKLEVYREWVLLSNHLKKVSKSIMSIAW